MPAYYNEKRIKKIFKGEQQINDIYFQGKKVWSRYANFTTLPWKEINLMIKDGTWKDNKWDVGQTHEIKFKDGSIGRVRIIGINDGRELKENWNYQIDTTESGEKAHLTLELMSCLKDIDKLFEQQSSPEAQTWSDSLIYPQMQIGGKIYENLPDELKSMILQVVKKSGTTGTTGQEEPVISNNYLFIPSLIEYIGIDDYTHNINTKEGKQYEFYNRFLGSVPKKLLGTEENIMYYTRSAATFENSLKDYFWGIGDFNSYSVYPSYTQLGITFAFCI